MVYFVQKIFGIFLVSLISLYSLSGTIHASELDQKEGVLISQTVTNEYDLFKKLYDTSPEDLKSLGYSNEDIDYIKNFDYKAKIEEKIKKMKTENDKSLRIQGYDENQIDTIQEFTGSERDISRVSANLTLSTIYSGSSKTNTYSSVTFLTFFNWSSEPIFLLTDILAVPWTEGMYLDTSASNASIVYTNAQTGAYIKTSYPNVVPDLNRGAYIKFDLGYPVGGTQQAFSSSGNFNYRLYKSTKVNEVAIQPSYGHTTVVLGSPTVTFPAGLAVSFSYQTSKAAEQYVYQPL